MIPRYKPEGRLESQETKVINKRIRDLFTSKLGTVIVNSADGIVISAFLGLQILAIYQNYYYIISAIIGILSIVYTSCLAGIGNSLITESTDKNFRDLKRLTFIICWISGFCTVCFLCLYQPFMELWMGRELMLDYGAVICFAIYFFVYEINTLLNMFKDAAGIWHSDRFRPLVTAFSNLVMNLILVNYWGIYGVLLSTVLSTLFVGMPWLLHNLFSTVFEKSLIKQFLLQLIKYVGVILLSSCLAIAICSFVSTEVLLVRMIINLVVCFIIISCLFVLLFMKTDEFSYCIGLFGRIFKKFVK